MKYLITTLILFFLISCSQSNSCLHHYYMSAKHEARLEIDPEYQQKYVNEHKYTAESKADIFSTYKELWGDAIEIYQGCPDTLILTPLLKKNP